MDRINDIKKFAEIVERSILEEASLRDIASNIGTSIKAAFGDPEAVGRKEAKLVADTMKANYKRWLGRTGQEASEESLMQYLVAKVGFTVANARKLFDKSGIDDPTRAPDDEEEEVEDTEEEESEHDLGDWDDEDEEEGKKPEAKKPAPNRSEPTKPNAAKADPEKDVKESILLELDTTAMDTLFQNAANFALKHDLVKLPGETSSSDTARDSLSGSTRSTKHNSTPSREKSDDVVKQSLDNIAAQAGVESPTKVDKPIRQKPTVAVNQSELVRTAKDIGLSKNHIEDMIDIVSKMKSYDKTMSKLFPQEKEQLTKIGFAFLRSLNK